MINIISSEIYKICKSKIFYGVLAIFFASNFFAFFSVLKVRLDLKSSQEVENVIESGISSFQSCYNADGILYIIIIFATFSIVSEYMNKNIRQIVCRGISRWKIVLGQYIALSLVMTIILLSFGYINLLVFSILSHFGNVDILLFLRVNLGLICITSAVSAIGVFIAHLIKNMGISIIVSIVLITGSNILASALSIITKNNIFEMLGFTNIRKVIVNFNSSQEEFIICCLALIIITIILIIVTSLLFSKRDID